MPTGRDLHPPTCRRFWLAALRVAKACLRDPNSSFSSLEKVDKMLCQVGKILCTDTPRRIEDDRQMFAGGLGNPYAMPNIGLKQGRLIREQTFFPERGHRELELVHGQSENVARLPVVAHDQRANIRL